MNKSKSFFSDWPLHLTILIVVLIVEKINIVRIPLGPGSLMFLPMLFAMVISLILYLAKPITWIGPDKVEKASQFVVIGISLFIAKVAVTSGSVLNEVIKAGPALILQEFGNLATMTLALPVALLLGFKRETIGMTHSIAREPNVGLIASMYGLDSPEGRGVMTIYTVGTILGTIFMGILSSLVASLTPLHPYAVAMATGVGSGSMMAAASAPLVELFPSMATEIQAYAATSNILSTADGIFLSIILGIPMANWLYKKLEPKLGKGKEL